MLMMGGVSTSDESEREGLMSFLSENFKIEGFRGHEIFHWD